MRGNRRRWIGAVLVVTLVAAAAVAWVLLGNREAEGTADLEDNPFKVQIVTRTTLTVGETLPGRLGYGSASPIPLRVTGTVTRLPKLGAVARQGDILLEVDGRPIVLMYGTTPAYRALDAGVPADAERRSQKSGNPPADLGTPQDEPAEAVPPAVGTDVRQLEEGLQALGYSGFTVDEDFTSNTASAVRAWQSDLGLTPTGRVLDGDVVFLPGPVRLQPDAAALGRAATETSVLQTGLTQIVTVPTLGQELAWASEGEPVTITLPNQTTLSGRVLRAGASSAGAMGDDTSSEEIVIGLPHPPQRGAEPGPVAVTHVSAKARNVLTVPVLALVALAEGGYGIQLEDGEFLAVTPGLYADGMVEVSGTELREGLPVRVPL